MGMWAGGTCLRLLLHMPPHWARLCPMHFDSFDDVTQWLDSFTPPFSSSPGLIREARLDRMRLLLAALGNPEDGFKAIHVAGSKGKGSTCRFISAMLAASGERTGLYLSGLPMSSKVSTSTLHTASRSRRRSNSTLRMPICCSDMQDAHGPSSRQALEVALMRRTRLRTCAP